jgi:hypothetical protein
VRNPESGERPLPQEEATMAVTFQALTPAVAVQHAHTATNATKTRKTRTNNSRGQRRGRRRC